MTTLSKTKNLFVKHKDFLGILLAVVGGIIVYFLPIDLPLEEKSILSVLVFMLVLFITEAMPLGLAGLFGCTAFWAFCNLGFGEAFAGFSENTPWFVLGALMIGAMAAKSGIPNRIAYHLLRRVGVSYPAILLGLIILDFLLTMVIPSGSARVVVLCTIAMGLIDGFGLDHKSNVAKGMLLILTYSATIFDKTILAGSASILARGVIETMSGVEISWGRWFIAYAPIDILTILCLWFMTLKMFPPETKNFSKEKNQEYATSKLKEMGAMTPANYRVLIILLIAMVLWATDFIHGLPPALIGLTAGLIAFVPGIGILDRDDFSKLNFALILFIGAAISMGIILDNTTILDPLSNFFFSLIEPVVGNSHLLTAILYFIANIFHLFLGSEITLLGVTMPAVMDFAMSNGLHPETIGMIWTFSAGGKLFIYQSAVLVLGYSFGTFSTKDVFKVGAMVILVEGFLVSVVVPIYWELIGFSFYV